ncbi:hypothetical protein EMCG_04584 [[Emmonsia] crescens]|uniref:Uncharacterized protein n=1 Tax=[Emmonsia] crescens TaxID=73230 RepID=A0A0G2J7A6_9EURO|nr:hypothetical protein EMCG_04584 [Emmonsia crescens UAMH 3008]
MATSFAYRSLSPRLRKPFAISGIMLLVYLAAFCLFCSIVKYFFSSLLAFPGSGSHGADHELIVAALSTDNTSWLDENLPDWKKNVYIVDNPKATLTVPKNKGRESMVYLTYIIDHYDHLPKHMVFIHSQRYQWHNDDPLFDNVPILKNLQLPFLSKEGYLNLRCVWMLGCPVEIRPFEDTERKYVHAGAFFKGGFEELFPGTPVPQEVGVSCCAQFAVTGDQVRKRPKSEYEHFRQWLLNTPLPDELSGRIFEYSWHMIFGREPIHCPTAEDCYCKQFGLCNLTCKGQGSCEGRYTLPPYSNLPQGWPDIGWDGKPRRPNDPIPAWKPQRKKQKLKQKPKPKPQQQPVG